MSLLLALLLFPLAATAQAPCGAPTPADIEGPFYKAGAPARASLAEPGSKAEKLVLSGVVRSADCKPLAGTTLDFWQADAGGEYDNRGYRYRGSVIPSPWPATDEGTRHVPSAGLVESPVH